MPMADKTSLEDFSLKGLHLAKMTGVSTGVHAVKDAFLLMHTGVGCKYKAAAQIAQHDWGAHPNRRESWTQVGEVSLIRGSGARIGPFARSWYERRRPGFMVVVSAYFIELTGEDISDLVTDTERSLPCPMAVIRTAAPNGGFFEGYMEVMYRMAETLDWKTPATNPKTVTVMGNFFHRYEPDQAADVAQVNALIEVAGLTPGPVWFSGCSWEELSTSNTNGILATLPYTRVLRRKFKKLARKRAHVELNLPMGFGGTRRFVTQLTEQTGGDVPAVQRWCDAQVEAVTPHLGPLTQGFGGVRVAVFADTPYAIGLVTLLRELGLQVPVVGLRDDVLGGKAVFYDEVGKNGASLAEDCTVLLRPSLRQMRSLLLERVASRDIHAVIGSSIELDVLSRARTVKGSMQGVALLEAGFPTKHHHATLPLPTFGYTGVLVWAQRIVRAVLEPRVGAQPGA